jgi:predicted transcriptional regulator
VTVAELMDPDPVAIPAGTVALEAYEDYFLRYGYDWFAVTEADGAYIGRAYREPIRQASDTGRPVRDLVVIEDDMVRDDATLQGLLASDVLRRVGSLVAVDAEGRLRGIVTTDDVARALRTRLAPGAT